MSIFLYSSREKDMGFLKLFDEKLVSKKITLYAF